MNSTARQRHANQQPPVPVIRLWVTSGGVSMVIHVRDGSDEMPVVKGVAADEENGRGLMLVTALGKDWGSTERQRAKWSG